MGKAFTFNYVEFVRRNCRWEERLFHFPHLDHRMVKQRVPIHRCFDRQESSDDTTYFKTADRDGVPRHRERLRALLGHASEVASSPFMPLCESELLPTI